MSFAQILAGNYPTRVFGSLSSFYTLTKLFDGSDPDIIIHITDETTIDLITAQHQQKISQKFPNSLFIHIMDEKFCRKHIYQKTYSHCFKHCIEYHDRWDIIQKIQAKFAKIVDFSKRSGRIQYKNLVLDMDRWQLSIDSKTLSEQLSLKEGVLLKLFMENSGACMSREDIKARVWDKISISPRTIDSHISRLRKKIQNADITIESIYGGGYIFE